VENINSPDSKNSLRQLKKLRGQGKTNLGWEGLNTNAFPKMP
jgi:hypothetical protein